MTVAALIPVGYTGVADNHAVSHGRNVCAPDAGESRAFATECIVLTRRAIGSDKTFDTRQRAEQDSIRCFRPAGGHVTFDSLNA
jgi:hypothetical protein